MIGDGWNGRNAQYRFTVDGVLYAYTQVDMRSCTCAHCRRTAAMRIRYRIVVFIFNLEFCRSEFVIGVWTSVSSIEHNYYACSLPNLIQFTAVNTKYSHVRNGIYPQIVRPSFASLIYISVLACRNISLHTSEFPLPLFIINCRDG